MVLRRALDLLKPMGCHVVHSSINKPRLAANYQDPLSPHLLAFQFMIETVEGWLAWQSDTLSQRALLVADETHEHERFVIDMVRRQQQTGFGQVKGKQLEHIVDTVHFVRSHDNRCVQLADAVAYVLHRWHKVQHQPAHPTHHVYKDLRDVIDACCSTYRVTWP